MGTPLFGEKPNWRVDSEGRKFTGLHGKTKEEMLAIKAKRSPESYKLGSKKETVSYFYRDIEPVRMPTFEIGMCKKCKQYDIELGDGYCVDCYDKAMEKQSHQKRNELLKNGM